MKSVLFVHARRLEFNQQVSAAYCKVGNDEYIESYGKTYDGYLSIYIYVRVASRNRTLGTLKRNGFFAISVYLHAFCTILRGLVALSTSVTKK